MSKSYRKSDPTLGIVNYILSGFKKHQVFSKSLIKPIQILMDVNLKIFIGHHLLYVILYGIHNGM